MISVKEAQSLVLKHTTLNKDVEVPISESLGFVIAQDVLSPINLPQFNQSSMDGYAFCFDGSDTFDIVGEVKAGDEGQLTIEKGQAIRIFTGALIPVGCDTVVQQEHTDIEGNTLKITNKILFKKGCHVRLAGSQIKQGELALGKGHEITPATIGFLAAIGNVTIKVYKAPKVVLVITGNEIVQPGNSLQAGQIYDSNSFILEAALKELGVIEIEKIFAKDTKLETTKAVKQALLNGDVILLSGGISVGDYDFVEEVLKEQGVSQLFYKVKQKPGKPLFFGKKGEKLIFALPGNPASALFCFYNYVTLAIKKQLGFSNPFLETKKMPLVNAVKNNSDRPTYLRAKITNNKVECLEGQESFMLKSFANANALIHLPANCGQIEIGEQVEVLLF